MRDPIKCADCPKIIKDPWPNQVRCAACATAHNKKYRRNLYYQRKEQERVSKNVEKPVGKILTKREPVHIDAPAWCLKGKSADQIMIEARALGLSDGKYEALISCGMIERHCTDLGIDGLKVIDKAWNEFQIQREERRKKQKDIRTSAKSSCA